MKLVYVIWHDAYTRDAWEARNDAIGNCRNKYKCKTVGWLLESAKDHITICHTNNPLSVMGTLHIPRGCIKKIKIINVNNK